MADKFNVVTMHIASGYVTVSSTYDDLDDARARTLELTRIRENGAQVFRCTTVHWPTT